MSDIDAVEFPKISFSEALEIAEIIKSKNIKTLPSLQGELGYSPKSHGGSFFYKWAALSKFYGLLEPSRANLTFTRLGERIVVPLTTSDRVDAIRESLGRIPLIRSLFASLGASYHQDDFKIRLSSLTGATPAEVSAIAKRMEEIYKDAARFMSPDTLSTPAPSLGESDNGRWNPPRGPPAPDPVTPRAPIVPEFQGPVRNLHSEDGYFIRIVLNAIVIQEAIDVLEALKKRATSKPVSSQTKLADQAA